MSPRCLLSTASRRLYPYREDPALAAHRTRLLHRAKGRVLDLSDGWEADLASFRSSQVDHLTVAVRPAGRSRVRGRPGIPPLPWPVTGRSGTPATAGLRPTTVMASAGLDALWGPECPGGAVDAARDSGELQAPYDTVVANLTLCTIDSLPSTLAAIRSWLAPDGQLLIIGHVLGTGVTGLLQSTLRPPGGMAVARVGGVGCHLDQDLPAALRAAGLQLSDCARFTARVGAVVPVPCLAGVAGVARFSPT